MLLWDMEGQPYLHNNRTTRPDSFNKPQPTCCVWKSLCQGVDYSKQLTKGCNKKSKPIVTKL